MKFQRGIQGGFGVDFKRDLFNSLELDTEAAELVSIYFSCLQKLLFVCV